MSLSSKAYKHCVGSFDALLKHPLLNDKNLCEEKLCAPCSSETLISYNKQKQGNNFINILGRQNTYQEVVSLNLISKRQKFIKIPVVGVMYHFRYGLYCNR